MSVTKWNERSIEDWLDPSEVGRVIPGGISPAAVRKWCREGKIPGVIQLPNGRWRIPRSAIEEVLEAGRAG
ncbi:MULTISPECIES: helix-turn-helix domain-containing protein [unclassified Corynebacterium]|uniref:helix-turn-helix domain-containing protein n=1 Tax=unclassified Corynebacterium TaxID=2624378 RepID=UPI00124EADD2